MSADLHVEPVAKRDASARLSVLTPDCVGPLALSCLLAAQGSNQEVRRQAAHAVEQFQLLVKAFPPETEEGIFLGRLERVAYAAASTIIEADQEAKDSVLQAQQDYENALLGAAVKSQVYIGLIKWLVQLLLLMGVGFFLAKFGLTWAALDMAPGQQARAQWLPFALAFAVPVLLGVGQSLWRVYSTTKLVYRRDLRIQEARRRRRVKQRAAIRFAKDQARLAWEDFVVPGTYLPATQPTLDLLHALYMEELRTRITPPLSVLLVDTMKRNWRKLRARRAHRARHLDKQPAQIEQ